MDRLNKKNAVAGKYIIWRRPNGHFSFATGRLVFVGGAVLDEWGSLPAWVVWDDITYVIEYDEALVPQKLNYMSSKHVLEILCEVEVYIFNTEQERLIGLLKLTEQYGS